MDILNLALNLLGAICIAGVISFFCTRLMHIKGFTKNKILAQCLFAAIFGLFAVYSTNNSVQFNTAFINIRDVAPLMAGIAFGPIAGIGAGLIGGIERLFHQTATTIPCSIATILMGFIGSLIGLLNRNKNFITPIKGFFIGLLAELVHMTLILVINSGNFDVVWPIVQIIAFPMMIFNGLGLMFSLYIFDYINKCENPNMVKE